MHIVRDRDGETRRTSPRMFDDVPICTTLLIDKVCGGM